MNALVVGVSGFAGRHALAAFANARGADPEDDLENLAQGVDVLVFCGPTWEPDRKPEGGGPHPLLARALRAAQAAGVRRFVHLSSAAVYGPDHPARIPEAAEPRPVHAYERLKLREEEWLRRHRGQAELVVVRAAAGFGAWDPILERLLGELRAGRLRLVNGGRAQRTFLAGPDLGRALLAAALRGRPGATYLAGGFEGSWRDLLLMAAAVLGVASVVRSIPYDLAYLAARARWLGTRSGEVCWPNPYTLDLLAKNHTYDDGLSRRELSWSPQVGSFDEGVVELVKWFQRRPHPLPLAAGATSPQGGEVDALSAPPGK
ncbi:MAG TPA: NAD-dependent epimerase/dehydratase family protein [Candidatus Dormibacteraeota bacterium]